MSKDFEVKIRLVPEIQLAGLSDKLKVLNASMAKLGGNMSLIDEQKIQAEFNKIDKAISQTKIAMASTAQETDNLTDSIKNVAGAGSFMSKSFNFNQITQTMQTLTDAFGNFGEPYKKLDTATASIKTLGAEAAKMAPNLREMALSMSNDLPIAAEKIQLGFADLIASGVQGTEEDLKKYMETAGKLAVGGGAALESVTKGLNGTLNAFGASSREVGKYSDTFFNVINFGVTTLEELNSSLSGVTPTAAAMGISFDKVGGSLALLTQKGVPTAQATTKLNSLFVEMAKPTAGIKSALDAAGVSMQSFQNKLKNDDLLGALNDLQTGFTKTGKSATESFSSSEAGAAFNVLMGDAKLFEQTLNDVANTTGSTENAYQIMADTVAVKTEQMKAKFDTFMINVVDAAGPLGAFGTVASGVFSELSPQLTALAGIKQLIPEGAFKSLNSLIIKLIPSLASIGVTGTTAFAGVGTASTVAGTAATTAGTATGTAWSLALSPLMAIIAAGVLVGSIFYYLYTRVESFRDAIDGFVDLMKTGFNKGIEITQKLLSVFLTLGEHIFTWLIAPFKIAWGVISGLIKPFVDLSNSTKLTTTAVQFLGTAFDYVLKVLNYIQAGFEGFTALLETMTDSLSGVILKVLKGDVVGAVSELMKGGKQAGDAFNKSFTKTIADGKIKKAISDQTKDAGKAPNIPPPTPPPAPPPSGETLKQKKTELEIANSLFESYQKTKKIKQEETETAYESVRIAQKREKSNIDDLGIQNRKLQGLNDELSKFKEIYKIKELSNGDLTVGLNVKDDEKQKIVNNYKEILNSISKETNTEAQIKAKVSVDEVDLQNSLRKLEIDKTKYEIEIGVKPSYAILPFLEEDLKFINDKISELETQRDKFKVGDSYDVPEDQQAYFTNLTKQLTDYQSKQLGFIKEIRSEKQKIYQKEISDLEEKHDIELQKISKRIETEKKITELMANASVNVGSNIADKQKDSSLKELDSQKELGLISEEYYNKKKEDLEAQHQKKMNAIKDASIGYTLEAERRYSLTLLQEQQNRLQIERQKAEENGDIERTKQIDKQLADITLSIQEKGDILTSYSFNLQSTLTEAFSNLFEADEEAIKAPFRKLFSIIGGALKNYLSLLVTEMVFGELKNYVGSMGLTALVLIPAFQGIANAALGLILDPILGEIASFSTGGRVDEPTLAIVGDASKTRAGRDTEWILRDDQIWLIVEESVKRTLDLNQTTTKAIVSEIISNISKKNENSETFRELMNESHTSIKTIVNDIVSNISNKYESNDILKEVLSENQTTMKTIVNEVVNDVTEKAVNRQTAFNYTYQAIIEESVKRTLESNQIVTKTLVSEIVNDITTKFENKETTIKKDDLFTILANIEPPKFDLTPIVVQLNQLNDSIQKIKPLFKPNEFTYENVQKLSTEYNYLSKTDEEYRTNKISEDTYLDRISQSSLKIQSFAGGSGFLTKPQLAIVGDAGANNPEIVLNNPQLQAIISQASSSSNKEVISALHRIEKTLGELQLTAVLADVRQATDEINRENNRRLRR